MALIKCPECGREISDKAPTCPGCGFAPALVKKCAECGEILKPGAEFCPKCGCPVEEAAEETLPEAVTLPQPERVIMQKAGTAYYVDGVILKGESGNNMVFLVLAIVCGIPGAIELFKFAENLFTNGDFHLTILFFVFFGLTTIFWHLFLGWKIFVTETAIIGRIKSIDVSLPISTVRSAATDKDNTIIITVNNKNKRYKFKNIPDHVEIVNAINSLISSR